MAKRKRLAFLSSRPIHAAARPALPLTASARESSFTYYTYTSTTHVTRTHARALFSSFVVSFTRVPAVCTTSGASEQWVKRMGATAPSENIRGVVPRRPTGSLPKFSRVSVVSVAYHDLLRNTVLKFVAFKCFFCKMSERYFD